MPGSPDRGPIHRCLILSDTPQETLIDAIPLLDCTKEGATPADDAARAKAASALASASAFTRTRTTGSSF